MAPIRGNKVIDALIATGIVREEDLVRRVVIDVPVTGNPLIYVERYGDGRVLEVVQALTSAEVRVIDQQQQEGTTET